MSSEWLEKTLGEFVRLQRGHDLTASEQKNGPYPVMGSAGQNGSHNVAKVKGPGVVIGRSGASMGRVHYTDLDFWPHNTCLFVTDFQGNNPRFAYYLLSSLDLAGYNSGSAQPSLNRNYIYAMPLRIPIREKQDRIAEILCAIDDRIELLRETNTTLEAIAQALFKSWFVDFDPVRAKAEGRIPEGMDAATAALFPDSFEESELGLIPKGWKVKSLSSLATFQNGYAFKSSDWTSSGCSVIKIGDVKPLIIDVHGGSKVSEETVVGLDKFKLSRGDLLVGMTGYVGETGLVPSSEMPAYLNQRVGKIATDNGLEDIGIVFCAVRNSGFKIFAETHAQGSAQANISGSTLMTYQLVVPCDDILGLFNEKVGALIKKIINNSDCIQVLMNTRDELLPRLISGQLRLPDAEAMLDQING